jgi:hypothetical protein
MADQKLTNAQICAAKNADYTADLCRNLPSNIDNAALHYRLLSKATTSIRKQPNNHWAKVMTPKILNPRVHRNEQDWDIWEETAKKWR